MGLTNRRFPGDRGKLIDRAQDWNSILDAAIDARNARAGDQAGEGAERQPVQIVGLVQNNSGAGLDRFAVLALGAPLIMPSDNLAEFKARPTFDGHLVAAADVAGQPARWCVLLEAIPPGGVGLAQLAGVAPVQVNMLNASDPYADLLIGETHMQSGQTGAKILWVEAGTGLKWAFVAMDAQIVTHIKVTSQTKTLCSDGIRRYPAKEQIYVLAADTWVDGDDCWDSDANGN